MMRIGKVDVNIIVIVAILYFLHMGLVCIRDALCISEDSNRGAYLRVPSVFQISEDQNERIKIPDSDQSKKVKIIQKKLWGIFHLYPYMSEEIPGLLEELSIYSYKNVNISPNLVKLVKTIIESSLSKIAILTLSPRYIDIDAGPYNRIWKSGLKVLAQINDPEDTAVYISKLLSSARIDYNYFYSDIKKIAKPILVKELQLLKLLKDVKKINNFLDNNKFDIGQKTDFIYYLLYVDLLRERELTPGAHELIKKLIYYQLKKGESLISVIEDIKYVVQFLHICESLFEDMPSIETNAYIELLFDEKQETIELIALFNDVFDNERLQLDSKADIIYIRSLPTKYFITTLNLLMDINLGILDSEKEVSPCIRIHTKLIKGRSFFIAWFMQFYRGDITLIYNESSLDVPDISKITASEIEKIPVSSGSFFSSDASISCDMTEEPPSVILVSHNLFSQVKTLKTIFNLHSIDPHIRKGFRRRLLQDLFYVSILSYYLTNNEKWSYTRDELERYLKSFNSLTNDEVDILLGDKEIKFYFKDEASFYPNLSDLSLAAAKSLKKLFDTMTQKPDVFMSFRQNKVRIINTALSYLNKRHPFHKKLLKATTEQPEDLVNALKKTVKMFKEDELIKLLFEANAAPRELIESICILGEVGSEKSYRAINEVLKFTSSEEVKEACKDALKILDTRKMAPQFKEETLSSNKAIHKGI